MVCAPVLNRSLAVSSHPLEADAAWGSLILAFHLRAQHSRFEPYASIAPPGELAGCFDMGAVATARTASRGASLLRLRPIMMTALVACLGLLPAALATGIGSDTQKPFAIVIVAGLISRLFIGFFVNPVLYQMVAREGDSPSGIGLWEMTRKA